MPDPPRDELTDFQTDVRAVAEGADDLAFRRHGYRLLLGAGLGARPSQWFASWAQVARAVEEVQRRTPALDPQTSLYLAGMLRALLTFARVRDGARLSYLEQVAAFLELDDVWVPEAQLADLRARVVSLLGDLGYPADLAAGRRRWQAARAVPIERIASVARPRLDAAKQAAIALGIPVPSATTVDVVIGPSPYYAYAHYHGQFRGTIALASELTWTDEAISHSICHEGFPGHQASAAAREAAIAAGRWGPVVLPSLANTPVSPVLEGLAENGAAILGWVRTPDEELFAAVNRLTFGVLTNAAILCHQHGEPRRRVIAVMIDGAGVAEDWAQYQYGFITDPLWHTSFPHYWHGGRLVRAALDHYRGRERRLFAALYARPQTTSTLGWLMSGKGGAGP